MYPVSQFHSHFWSFMWSWNLTSNLDWERDLNKVKSNHHVRYLTSVTKVVGRERYTDVTPAISSLNLFVAQFYRATKSQVCMIWRVSQLFNSRATFFRIKQSNFCRATKLRIEVAGVTPVLRCHAVSSHNSTRSTDQSSALYSATSDQKSEGFVWPLTDNWWLAIVTL